MVNCTLMFILQIVDTAQLKTFDDIPLSDKTRKGKYLLCHMLFRSRPSLETEILPDIGRFCPICLILSEGK